MDHLEIMREARDLFAVKGGSRGSGIDAEGRICALVALADVTKMMAVPGPLDLKRSLDEIAIELFGHGLVKTNDEFGKEAILTIFDKKIAELEEKVK